MTRRAFLPGLGLLLLLGLLLPGLVVQAEFGTNWSGTFYNCTDLNCPVADTGTYPNGLNANWGTGSPVDEGQNRVMTAVNADGFSARFFSTQTFQDGQYEFFVTFESGARMFIDGTLVMDEFSPRPLTTVSFTRQMTAGNHQLIVEYLDDPSPDTNGAVIQVQWFLGGGAVPTPTTAPVATASVHTVRGLAVRTGPYLGGSLIAVARPDNTYNVLAKNDSEGIYTWYLIEIGDQVGWSSGRYLTVEGAANVPFQNTHFDNINNAPDIGVTAIPRAIMNFRVRPSVRTQRIGQIAWGEEVSLIGRTIQGGRNFWFQVRRDDGTVGWIFAPYVSVRGPIDAVPIH